MNCSIFFFQASRVKSINFYSQKLRCEHLLPKFGITVFKFRREEDGEIIRELPATGPGIKRAQPLLRYLVTVVTGNKRNAGTNADVFCCIYGDQGDTGDRPLLESKKNRDKFERNNVRYSICIDKPLLGEVSFHHKRKRQSVFKNLTI